MATWDDLVIQARRGRLTEAELQQLRGAQRSSPNARLALRIAEAFEHEGLPQAGDQAAAQEIWRAVAGERPSARPPSKPGRGVRKFRVRRARWGALTLGVGIPLWSAVAAAAAYGSYRWVLQPLVQQWTADTENAALPAASRNKPRAVAPRERDALQPHPSRSEAAMDQFAAEPTLVGRPLGQPEETKSSAAKPSAALAAIPQGGAFASEPVGAKQSLSSVPPRRMPSSKPSARRIAVPPRLRESRSPIVDSLGAPSSPASLPTSPLPRASAVAALPPDPSLTLPPSASPPVRLGPAELLRRAQELRAASWSEAMLTYRQLISQYPASEEAGVAEMVLAKRHESQGRWALARGWYAQHARRARSPLLVEALWGMVSTSRQLQDDETLFRALERVWRDFPQTPYGQEARDELKRRLAEQSAASQR